MIKQMLFAAVALFGVQAASADSYIDYRDGVRYRCERSDNGGGNGGGYRPAPPSCSSGCQQFYNVRTWINSQWQDVATCAYETRCEVVSDRCVRRTECAQFQTTRTWTNSQWQDIVSCAGTRSDTICN